LDRRLAGNFNQYKEKFKVLGFWSLYIEMYLVMRRAILAVWFCYW
jgi:hypothetical protein